MYFFLTNDITGFCTRSLNIVFSSQLSFIKCKKFVRKKNCNFHGNLKILSFEIPLEF